MTNLETIEPKPRDIVIRQYIDRYAADCERNPFWYSPDNWYRWLVCLDCGCVTEVLTREDTAPPTEHIESEILGELPIYKQTWVLSPPAVTFKDGKVHPHSGPRCVLDRGTNKLCPGGYCYPKGYLWCAAHEDKPPWREIIEWLHRQEGTYESGKAYSSWKVRLSCGHCDSVASDPEWSPGMPPNLDLRKMEAIQEMLRTRNDMDDDLIRFHQNQVKFKGFMVCSPPVHTDCAKCAYQRRIVEYGIIGKLAEHPLPKPKPVEKPQPTSEEINAKKLRRLQRIESDVARLQAEAEKLRADIHISKEGTE